MCVWEEFEYIRNIILSSTATICHTVSRGNLKHSPHAQSRISNVTVSIPSQPAFSFKMAALHIYIHTLSMEMPFLLLHLVSIQCVHIRPIHPFRPQFSFVNQHSQWRSSCLCIKLCYIWGNGEKLHSMSLFFFFFFWVKGHIYDCVHPLSILGLFCVGPFFVLLCCLVQ